MYSFSNNPIGTYTFVFEKPGFGDYKIFNFNSLGAGEADVNQVNLYRNPDYLFYDLTEIPALVIATDGSNRYYLDVDFKKNDPKHTDMQGVLAFGMTPDFSLNDNSCIFVYIYYNIDPTRDLLLTIDITEFARILSFSGVTIKGTTVYSKLYPLASASIYTDLVSGNVMYPAFGTSTNTNFILP